MKKRIVALLLGVCMIATMLVGCGGGASQTSILSEMNEELDLSSVEAHEIGSFLKKRDIGYTNPMSMGFVFEFDYTFLDFDAEYNISVIDNPANGHQFSVDMYVYFDSQEELNDNKELIKRHIETKLGVRDYVLESSSSRENALHIAYTIKN